MHGLADSLEAPAPRLSLLLKVPPDLTGFQFALSPGLVCYPFRVRNEMRPR